jgi:IS5 family transposase
MEQRKPLYRDLVKVTEETIRYAHEMVGTMTRTTQRKKIESISLTKLGVQLSHYMTLAGQAVDQTKRRVFEGESVPANEKIVSIFEEHTDVIVKDRRDTLYGHKILLSSA